MKLFGAAFWADVIAITLAIIIGDLAVGKFKKWLAIS
jgi:hypothetical protein